MANKEIHDLLAAGALTGAEILHLVQSGSSRRATVADLADAFLVFLRGANNLSDLADAATSRANLGFDQDVFTTSNVTFNDIDVTGEMFLKPAGGLDRLKFGYDVSVNGSEASGNYPSMLTDAVSVHILPRNGFGVGGLYVWGYRSGSASMEKLFEANDTNGCRFYAPLNTPRGPDLTISSGVITATHTYHRVETEGTAATDDLDTITAGKDGQLLILRSSFLSRDPTLKHGTGNLALAGGADFTLANEEDKIMLIYDSDVSKWCEISRSTNA